MINIGFDDDALKYMEEHQSELVEGEQKARERQMTVNIPQRRIEQFKAEYDCVVANDFGDEYHLSEEERLAKNKFYEAFKKFSKFKHKYRSLPEYIVAMREALKCLDFVAENNGVYDPDEFKKLYLRGKIYINGLILPQFKGRDKKSISWDYLTEFILSDEDPENIIQKKDDEILSSEDYVDLEKVLFDKGELSRITREETDEEITKKNLFFDVDEDEPEGDTVIFMTNKESRKFIKSNPDFLFEIKEMKRDNRKLSHLDSYAHDLTSDDIDALAEYDQIHNYMSSSDVPQFKGDLMNDDDYNKYLMELEEFELTQIKDNYHGRIKTLEEINELEIKQLLEANGWNIRNIYDNKEKAAKLKKIQAKEKKREKELRQKLIDVQNRRKRRMGEDVIDAKEKKGDKKKKKKKDKTEKKAKKESDRIKKEMSNDIDEFLLAASERTDDFKDYKEESLDWSWDSIMGE